MSKRFKRQEWFRQKCLGEGWRAPKGWTSKMRLGKAGKAAIVSIGWRSAKKTRGLHPSGLRESLVHNVDEVKKLKTGFAVRIASGVGKRKRDDIRKAAKEMKLKALN